MAYRIIFKELILQNQHQVCHVLVGLVSPSSLLPEPSQHLCPAQLGIGRAHSAHLHTFTPSHDTSASNPGISCWVCAIGAAGHRGAGEADHQASHPARALPAGQIHRQGCCCGRCCRERWWRRRSARVAPAPQAAARATRCCCCAPPRLNPPPFPQWLRSRAAHPRIPIIEKLPAGSVYGCQGAPTHRVNLVGRYAMFCISDVVYLVLPCTGSLDRCCLSCKG